MNKKKYVFISNMASPNQVKFSTSLQEYFDTEFWFYEYLDETRPSWWKIPLGENCKVLRGSFRIPNFGYASFGVFYELLRFRPDIIVLGGFIKWHWIILKFAKLFNIKVAVMSEPLRYVNHDDDQSTTLMTNNNSDEKIKLLKKAFKDVDLYIGMGDVAANQFLEEFKFPKEKVIRLLYPQDIESCFNHPLRIKKRGDRINFLFASRLVARYQPLVALQAFEILSSKYENIFLFMNSNGVMKKECEKFIAERNINNVFFLEDLKSWDQMHKTYESADVLLLPAQYSNGSNALIEARASGLGVIMSNQINNVKRHSINTENCFICNPNINAFVKNMEKYIVMPELLYSHGKLSKELIKTRRNKNTAKLYYEAFKEHGLVDLN